MTLAELNVLPRYRAEEEFLKCCNSAPWARALARRRPFASLERLLKASDEIWQRFGSAGPDSPGAEEENKHTRLRLMALIER